MSLAAASTALRATGAPSPAEPADTPAREIPPDITSVGILVRGLRGATVWLVFILYAASRGLG